MSLITFNDVSLEFGDQKILTLANFVLEPNERVCLIGRNGAGKSTMMKLMTGEQQADSGEIQYRQNLRISKLDQQLPGDVELTVAKVVEQGLAWQKDLILQFETLSEQELDQQGMHDMQALQQQIDASGGWDLPSKVETIISQLNLPAEKRLGDLSGGWQRRVALGKALVSKPDVLLLDEPTNHLDISTIEWLEHMVRGYKGSVVFITHDRSFLQKLATRIVEIDRGVLISWPGNYQNYLTLKEKANAEEDTHNKLFDKRLAQEETWIRQGIKARRTRNEGRVRALEAMREEYGKRIKRQGKARIQVEEAEKSGRKVIEARNITHGYGGDTLIKDFSLKMMRGDRIGLIGNNGVGKSTLLRILLGEIAPDQGSVKLGTALEIGYFDQIRRELDMNKSVAHNVSDGKDYITINGKERHVVGYLKNFLFSPKRALTPVKALSGGECNRILLAKMFTRATNFLILDEPTNDLDVEMLEVLEQQLVEFKGTLIVVSHDRDFLDNVVTSTLVFEENNHVQHYVGGYSDWVKRGKVLEDKESPNSVIRQLNNAPQTEVVQAKKKLSYKLQRELDLLPDQIEQLEKDIDTLQQQTTVTDFYNKPYDETQPVIDALSVKQSELDKAVERWSELEAM